MSFRKIRPSFGAESSASHSNQSQSTSESAGSDPTSHIQLGDRNDSAATPSSSSTSKRRRVPESVTRNACLNCKKARAKCDGKKPCARCATRVESSPCVYEIHIKHAKEELVKQIKELRAGAHTTEQILGALSTDEQVPQILLRLKNGDSYDSIVDWLGRAPMDDFETLSPRESQQSGFEPADQEMGGIAGTLRWTTVSNDSAIFDHLFQLYFAWIHPVHPLFSEGHFVDSYKRPSQESCSSALVNAICAIACHLHSSLETDEVDFDQLGNKFSEAARSNLDPFDRSITTVQAFAVMFLVDCARGKCLRATSYLKVASEILSVMIRTEGENMSDVVRHTHRGLRSLSVEWAQMTFQIPSLAHPFIPERMDDSEQAQDVAQWYYYRDPSDQCPAWPGLMATTNREKAKLIEIIYDAIVMHYSPNITHINARHILQIYARLLSWRDNMPSILGNTEENSQVLPHVLSLLFVLFSRLTRLKADFHRILHATAVTQLLRPLLEMQRFPSEQVKQVIWHHTQQGLFYLYEHYNTQYTTRYQPVLQMFATLHLCDIIARFFPTLDRRQDTVPKDGATALRITLEILAASRRGFPIAGPLQTLLKRTADELRTPIPANIEQLMVSPRPPRLDYRMDDLIDACTRPTYIQPVAEILTKYSTTFIQDWQFEAPRFGFGDERGLAIGAVDSDLVGRSEEERGAQNLMQIRNLLNMN